MSLSRARQAQRAPRRIEMKRPSFLWLGIASAPALTAGTFLLLDELQSNSVLGASLLLLAIPAAMTYATAVIAVCRRFGFKVLAVALLVLWPKAFVVALCAGPFIYLAVLLTRKTQSEAEFPPA